MMFLQFQFPKNQWMSQGQVCYNRPRYEMKYNGATVAKDTKNVSLQLQKIWISWMQQYAGLILLIFVSVHSLIEVTQ